MLLLMASLAFSYSLTVKVVVSQDTPASYTNVSIMQDGVMLYAAKADAAGVARFNLTEGDYFAVLPKSSIYPLQISLISITGDTSITLVKRELISYSNVYGRISGPESFTNASISAYSGGKVVSRNQQVSKYGYYLFSLYGLPEGNYELVYEAPGFDAKKMQAYLSPGTFIEADITLEKTGAKQNQSAQAPPVLSAPQQIGQFSQIMLILMQDDLPLSGEKIVASTPSGTVEISTDSSGKAYINAAKPGTYKFTYGGQSTSTFVVGSESAQIPDETKPAAPTPAATPSQVSAQPQSGIVLVAIAVTAIVVFICIVALVLLVSRKKGHAHPHAGKADEGAVPPHEAGAHAGKHQEEKHAHKHKK